MTTTPAELAAHRARCEGEATRLLHAFVGEQPPEHHGWVMTDGALHAIVELAIAHGKDLKAAERPSTPPHVSVPSINAVGAACWFIVGLVVGLAVLVVAAPAMIWTVIAFLAAVSLACVGLVGAAKCSGEREA